MNIGEYMSIKYDIFKCSAGYRKLCLQAENANANNNNYNNYFICHRQKAAIAIYKAIIAINSIFTRVRIKYWNMYVVSKELFMFMKCT